MFTDVGPSTFAHISFPHLYQVLCYISKAKPVMLTFHHKSHGWLFCSCKGRCGETLSCRTGEVSDLWWVQGKAPCVLAHNSASVCYFSHQLQCIMGGGGRSNLIH